MAKVSKGAILLLTASFVASGGNKMLATEEPNYQIKVQPKDKKLYEQEIIEIKGQLNYIEKNAPEPYKGYAQKAQEAIKDLVTARQALAAYNAHAMAAKAFGGRVPVGSMSMVGGHEGHGSGGMGGHNTVEALLNAVLGQAAECTKRLKELEDRIKELETSGGRGEGDSVLVADLRAEIARWGGGSIRAVEAVMLPSLNSPFIYVTGAAAVVSPQAAGADRLKAEISAKIDELVAAINSGTIPLKGFGKTKWINKLADFKEIVGERNVDWDEFSNVSIYIKSQNGTVFANGKIEENNPVYKALVDLIDKLTAMRAEVEAAQSEGEYEAQQVRLKTEDAATGNLDVLTDHFLDTVIPALNRVRIKLEERKDKTAEKLTEILQIIKTRKLSDLLKYLSTTDKFFKTPNNTLLQQRMVAFIRDPDWKAYETAIAQYKAAVAALGTNEKKLVLLHMLRHGKTSFSAIAGKIRHKGGAAPEVQEVLDTPHVFDLIGADRKKFMEKLDSLKVKYEKLADKNELAELVMDLYYSYYEAFDAASKLFYDENPPRKEK